MYRTILLTSVSVALLSYLLSLVVPIPWPLATPTTDTDAPARADPLSEQALSLPLTSTSIVLSRSPLLIYIPSFLTDAERDTLLAAGTGHFQDSGIYGGGGDPEPSSLLSGDASAPAPHRTSTSAFLSPSLPISQILTLRATAFLANLSSPLSFYGLEPPQLVRYASSPTPQYYKLHHDHFSTLLPDRSVTSFWRGGEGRLYNRVASFFVYVDVGGDVEGGGTWFPRVRVDDDGDGRVRELVEQGAVVLGKGEEEEEEEEGKGGATIQPRPGAAVFWVNLDDEGYGDDRTLHAGLPVTRGTKVGCNLWVKRDFGW